jgi:hypothetical protein
MKENVCRENIVVSALGRIYLATFPFCRGQARDRDRS